MKINVRGKNLEVTPSLKEYVEKRVGKLDKLIDPVKEAVVTLVVEKEMHRVEVTIPLNGVILRGEEETADMYSSIDNVVEKIERQIRKNKTKLSKKLKEGALKEIALGTIQIEEEEPQIVRTKKFALKPMSAEEAVLQMNLLGHSFFVYFDDEAQEVNVVYKRKDGNYGLIEPEF